MKLPKTPKKIQERIKRYESALRKEKRTYGGYDDGAGKRYLLVPLYTLMDDWSGAVKSYRWFEKNFPSDIGDPFHYLCGALAYFRTNDHKTAAKILRRAMFSNLYLLPRLLEQPQEALDIETSFNLEQPEYLDYAPPELWALWDEPALEWARETYASPEFTDARARYIKLNQELNAEPVGPRRTRLISERSQLRRG